MLAWPQMENGDKAKKGKTDPLHRRHMDAKFLFFEALFLSPLHYSTPLDFVGKLVKEMGVIYGLDSLFFFNLNKNKNNHT